MNQITIHEDYAELHLNGKQYAGRVALIDLDDVELVSKGTWRAVVTQASQARATSARTPVYASCRRKNGVYVDYPRYIYLHRLVMGITDRGVQVDHINHDTMDNRKSNLRIASHQQNHFNRRSDGNSRSAFKGVSWVTRDRIWRATITRDQKTFCLGEFRSEEEAAGAYDKAAIEMFGEYAYLNFGNEATR